MKKFIVLFRAKLEIMSDNKLGNLGDRKEDMLIGHQSIPSEIMKIDGIEQYSQIIRSYPDKIVVIDFWAD